MLPSLLDSSTLPVLEQVVNFAQSRHGVLAGNIANIDTPGYKTRDLSPEKFQESLKQALETRRTGSHVSPGISAASSQTRQIDAFRDVRDATKHELYHDESDVSLESQVTEIAKNQGMHNLAISLMSAQFRLLQAAISERVA
jgi:flagellar basal-body rod protein FlgB